MNYRLSPWTWVTSGIIHVIAFAAVAVTWSNQLAQKEEPTPNWVRATLQWTAPRPAEAPLPPQAAAVVSPFAARRQEKPQASLDLGALERSLSASDRAIREARERTERLRRRIAEAAGRIEDLPAVGFIAPEGVVASSEEEVLVARHVAAMTIAIQSNWRRLPGSEDLEAYLVVQLVPSGELVRVSLLRTSGSKAFDRSAERAVWTTAEFPHIAEVPSDVFEKYFRRLTLRFRPEGTL